MLRKRENKDISKEVRYSLEVLDNVVNEFLPDTEEESLQVTRRQLSDIPPDVRHSLGVLDDILGEFDIEENSDQERSLSLQNLRKTEDVPDDVQKSLEALDDVLEEIERDHLELIRPKREKSFRTQDKGKRHEDIRRSLEVLDSVLAEFDDCLDSWETVPDYQRDSPTQYIKKFDSNQNLTNGEKTSNHLSTQDPFSFLNASRDGSTSHISSISNVQEQPRVGSPPPIPKRSPTTKLSEKNRNLFAFPSDDTSLDSCEPCVDPSDNNTRLSSSHDHVVQQRISVLSTSPKKNGDTTHLANAEGILESDKCANCGRGLKQKTVQMESLDGTDDSSPFLQRRLMFEAKIAEASSKPPAINRFYGSSFRHKKPSETADSSGPTSLPANISLESGFANESHSRYNNEFSPKSLPNQVSAEKVDPSQYHASNCTCRQKIQQLNAKFSETRRLLKLKKIKGLDAKPPSFVPPPPLPAKINQRNRIAEDSKPTSNGDLPATSEESTTSKGMNHDSGQNSEMDSFYSLDCSSKELSMSGGGTTDSLKLCNRCSAHLSDTIEDLPHLLPTDALNRPQLGLCYSLEEDLSPGVKEIQKTSTPKSDISSPSLFRTKESNLSTFSHSVSSLGYVSSQSDLELNNFSNVPDKVPVTSFRSMTLPNGLDRSPFYSPVEDVQSNFDRMSSTSERSDFNDNRLPKDPPVKPGHHVSSVELHLRSSSAPLPPEMTEKPKKKHFRGFSRKSKKDRNKNEDDLSLKSDLSFDEGVLLRKIGAIDGSTVSQDAPAADKMELGVEKKRRSIWRSFLGK